MHALQNRHDVRDQCDRLRIHDEMETQRKWNKCNSIDKYEAMSLNTQEK